MYFWRVYEKQPFYKGDSAVAGIRSFFLCKEF